MTIWQPACFIAIASIDAVAQNAFADDQTKPGIRSMNKGLPLLSSPILAAGRPGISLCVLFLLALSARADNTTNQPPDLTDLPLEALMQIEVPHVVGASKFEQKETEAPASTTVITSDEIKRYGYRTLADILASVQGFYISYDRDYAFLGARGVSLNDANSRILLLVNGHRVNNDLDDSAAIDTSFLLDVDLIDRVEIIRGPSSVLYGNNAFFGVVNVITRQGKQINGVEASGMYGSYNSYSGRVTIGGQFTNGPQFLLSGTVYGSDGPQNLFYPQFNTPAQNNGFAHELDDDGSGSFFGSVGYQDFTVEGAFIDRVKGNPTAQYDTTFNDPRLRTIDDRSYATVKFAHQFPDALDVSANVYYDQSDFQISYPEDPLLFMERQTGEWAGGELQVDKKIWNRHVLTVGAEYRNDFRQDRLVFEPATGNIFTDVHGKRSNYGFFAQGDFEIVTNLHLNTGVRYDQYGSFSPSVSPRAALIYDPFTQSTFKFIYGTAFRDPNFVELSDPRFQDIAREKISSYEAVYEQGIGQNLRSSVSGYYNQMDDLIDFADGSYTNFNANTLGAELALEGKWANDLRTRLSYTLQHTKNSDTGDGLPDSPMHLVKFNVSAPVFADKVFAGLEVQYTSQRHTVFTDLSGNTLTGSDAPGYFVANFTLFSQNLVKNLDVSATIYNLFNDKYYDPSSNFHLQDVIQQNGRTFRVKVSYKF
jgi:iron complex outermembrane receptor protein